MSAKNYTEAVAHLSTLAPELHTLPTGERRKFTLAEIGLLCAALGDPQRRFPSVLIAGTNGKGSTAATLAAIAQAAGLRVGLYTSPHLERVNERVRISSDGQLREIDEDAFARHFFAVHDAAQQLVLGGTLRSMPSYFELLTALGRAFAEAGVELAVLEVGMGGRLDATNIVEPLVSVITDIALDHQEWLGETIDAIAREKAGILRDGGVMVTLPQHPEANQALGEVAMNQNVRGVNAAVYMPARGTAGSYRLDVMGAQIAVDSPLHGAHQQRNIALAIAAAVELAEHHNFPITPATIEVGIRSTIWPGRLETITASSDGQAAGPEIILDVAHNPAGAWALRAAVNALEESTPRTPRVLVFGCLRDKPVAELAQILFPLFDRVVLTTVRSPRATSMDDLRAAAEAIGASVEQADSVAQALERARAAAGDQGRIVVSGSVYLVGEARHLLRTEMP
jgi:dihydrofolate synthase/folylpolyglutamate synthase